MFASFLHRDELATAILKQKAKPNRLMVEEAATDDNSVVTMSQVSRNNIDLFFSYYMNRLLSEQNSRIARTSISKHSICSSFAVTFIIREVHKKENKNEI